MSITRRTLLGTGAAAALPPLRRARAQGREGAPAIRMGVLTDMSGTYRDISGPTSVAAAQLAAAESGMNVEVIAADHQNKPDLGVSIARQWFDRDGVDVVLDVATSSVALAVNGVVRERNKVHVNSTGATADLTGPACTPNTVHWTYDTWMLAHSTGGALVRQGGDTWFFITADYAFGAAMEHDATTFIRQAGGTVLGSVRHPFPGTTDFSSFLVQAQASKAKVIGLANAGADTINCIKQAHEFGIIAGGQKLAGLLVLISDVHALGLDTAQGLVLTESFYWDLNDRTRAFTQRLLPRTGGTHPASTHAGVYAGALHYLKAVRDMGVAEAKRDGAAAVARMKAMPTDDDAFGPGRIREDGRKIQPAYLFEVKRPAESKGAWDAYKLVATTPADQAYRPLNEGGCPLVHA